MSLIRSWDNAMLGTKDSVVVSADRLINTRHRALGCRAASSFAAKAAKLAGFVAA
jgi:hypothetical protein